MRRYEPKRTKFQNRLRKRAKREQGRHDRWMVFGTEDRLNRKAWGSWGRNFNQYLKNLYTPLKVEALTVSERPFFKMLPSDYIG